MTHDDATSNIFASAGTEIQALNPDWPGPVGLVSAITLAFRQQSGGFRSRSVLFSNAAGTLGSDVINVGDIVSWTTLGPTDAMSARPGGGSWVGSDFADDKTQFPTVRYVSGSGSIQCTSIWGGLTYTPPVGGLVFLLQLAGLGALPFVGAMDLSQFTRYLSWRRAHHPRHTILTGAEVRQAWDELRAYRHPRFFLPAV
jgi:hypothetical protein